MATTVGNHQQSAFSNPQAGQRPISSASVRDNDNALRVVTNAHDSDAGLHFQSSLLASRPTAAEAGRKWITTDGLRIYYDTGSVWSEVDYLSKTAGGTVAGNTTFSGTLTGTLTGNAATATALATGRTIAVSGDVTATGVSFDGTGNITLSAAITADSIVNADINSSAAIADTKLAQITTASKVANSATTATAVNTNSAIVARDGSGNFAAGTITCSGLTHTGTTITLRSIAYTLPSADGSAGQVLQTNGSGTLSWAAASAGFVTGAGTTGKIPKWTSSSGFGDSIMTEASTQINVAGSLRLGNNSPLHGRNVGNSGDVEIARVTTGDIVTVGSSSGTVSIAASGSVTLPLALNIGGVSYSFPGADGSSNTVLRTNGSGGLSWVAFPTVPTVSGTSGKLAKFTGTTAVGDSIVTESGTVLTVAGDVNAGSGYVFKANGTQVVGTRRTGYAPSFSGVTANRTPTLTQTQMSDAPGVLDEAATLVNLQELNAFVKAMYDDLVTHGLLGS